MPNPASTSHPLSPPDDLDEPLLATTPGFRPLPPPKGPDPLDPEATTIRPPASPSPDESGEGSWDESELGEPGSETSSPTGPGATSSPASTDPAIFIDVARTAVGIASIGVGWIRARRHGPAVRQAWLADEEDQANIGDPLARIAARRAPAAAGHVAPDVVDGIEAMMGAVNYGVRHATAEAELITLVAQGVDPEAGE